jgi:hypothetical protein
MIKDENEVFHHSEYYDKQEINIELNDEENNLYEKDEELETFLYMENNVQTIFQYIKKISKNAILPLFDKLSTYSLFNFLYENEEVNSEYLF